MRENFVLKGNICYSETPQRLSITENGYVVCLDGICKGVFRELPQIYQELKCYDYTDKLVIPGLVDLHVHAPQYPFRGLGMDYELIEWLNTHTFVEEAKYSDISYAQRSYDIFVDDLKKSATTRACVFGTLHTEATELLMKKLDEANISGFVGKVNMDRNCPEYLCEETAQKSVEDTKKWIEDTKNMENIRPILTPRFIPTCTDELMRGLSKLQKEYGLPVQSHLSENLGEIEWVKELSPQSQFYGDAYDQFDMFGGSCPTVMAHCVHSSDEEIQRMKEKNVFIAHCPESNTNLSSGIAPIRRYLDMGMKVGLGSDVAAGSSLSMFRQMSLAVQMSKMRWRLVDDTLAPLKVEEAFYLATKGGGEFFGKVGSFEEGYEFDAVVIDDTAHRHPQPLNVAERIERIIYLAEDNDVKAKYVKGKKTEE